MSKGFRIAPLGLRSSPKSNIVAPSAIKVYSFIKCTVTPDARNLPLLNQIGITPTQQVNDLQNSAVIVGENLSGNTSVTNTPIRLNCSAMPVGQSNNTAPQMPSTRYIEYPNLNEPALPNVTITPVITQNLGSVAASNVGGVPQRTFFENISPPAPYLRQTTVAPVANENCNNHVVVGSNNNQGVLGLTNNQKFVTCTKFANAFTMKILLYIDICAVKNQFMNDCRKYGMTEEILSQKFMKFYNLVHHEKLKQFSDDLFNYLNTYQVKNFKLKDFLLAVDKCANKNLQRSIYTRHVVWVLLEALDPCKDLCMANTGFLKKVYEQCMKLWHEDVENINHTRRPQAGTLMSEAQKEMFYRQCEQYYSLYMALWENQAHQPQQTQQTMSSVQLWPYPSMQSQSQPHLRPPVLSQDYPSIQSLIQPIVQPHLQPSVQFQQHPSMFSGIPQPSAQSWHPSMSSDVPQNQFSSSFLQQPNQQVQSIPFSNARDIHANVNINWMPSNQNIQGRITSAPFSPAFSHYPKDDCRIHLQLSKPYEPPKITPGVTATAPASETVPIPAPAAEAIPAAQDTASLLSCVISDCLDRVRQIFADGTSNSTEKPNENSDGVKQKDEEVDENVIDVDEWYAKKMMTQDVICLNPEYFNLGHFVKTDFDVKIETDTKETPDSQITKTQPEPQQQQVMGNRSYARIASADSGFSSPPRQIGQITTNEK